MTYAIKSTLRDFIFRFLMAPLLEFTQQVKYYFRGNWKYFLIGVGYLSAIFVYSYVYRDFIVSTPLIKWSLLAVGSIGWYYIVKLSMRTIKETMRYPGDSILTANHKLASAIKSKLDSMKYETYEIQSTFIDDDRRLLTASVYIWIKGPEGEFYRTYLFYYYKKKWEYYMEDFNDLEAVRIARKKR